jgi:hypothetical protein
VGEGTHITMVGYGTTGNGIDGFTPGSADFFVKRKGENVMDLFDGDDEGQHAGWEVWYADFDGNGKDSFCADFQVCTPALGNDKEAAIGPGDSGGPSFITSAAGQLLLVGNNTFGGGWGDAQQGQFGSIFGGNLLSPYVGWISSFDAGINVVPEPVSPAIFGLGLLALGWARRRSLR